MFKFFDIQQKQLSGTITFDGTAYSGAGVVMLAYVVPIPIGYPGKSMNSFCFSAGQYIDFPGLELAGSFTYSAWIRPYTVDEGYQCIVQVSGGAQRIKRSFGQCAFRASPSGRWRFTGEATNKVHKQLRQFLVVNGILLALSGGLLRRPGNTAFTGEITD